ncbi:molybdate ABC transporter substrate-binding protein [Thalassospira sp.]|uniref:molybdate ABC transporter substrate-binding protein n=1 Tax=Thalassospira sp. TaxID=1912094 RepID=UPI003AA7CE25
MPHQPLSRLKCPVFGLLVMIIAMIGSMHAVKARDITVFAAASLTNAIEQISSTYEEKTGDKIRLSLASSSTLARQIAAGAPADIFISANEKWMDWLDEQNLITPNSRYDLLANRLVLIAPKDSTLAAIDLNSASDLTSLIKTDERVAVGDPDHVPAGIYAKQALVSLGQWDALNRRLARTDNVRSALALVERGEAPIGIVYQTDADISAQVKIIGTFPENSHQAITYPVAMIENNPQSKAAKFMLWLLGDDASRIFADYGFEPLATTQAIVPEK